MAGASEGYRSLVGWDASPMSGSNQDGSAGAPNEYQFSNEGKIPSDWKVKNVIGLNESLSAEGGKFLRQSGTLSRVLNVIPGMNAIAQFHDTLFRPESLGGMKFNLLNNVSTMLPAAAVTYGAIFDQLPIDRSRCPSCVR